MERLLGAPSGSVNIFDSGRLSQWFELGELPAEKTMASQSTARTAVDTSEGTGRQDLLSRGDTKELSEWVNI
jgi:hypothetical protein